MNIRNFVNGASVDAVEGGTSELVDPTTGQVFASAPVSTKADVDAAYSAAAFGQLLIGSWRSS